LILGCQLKEGFVAVKDRQETSVENIFCAGEPTGLGGWECALVEGRIAGYAASGQAGKALALQKPRDAWHRFRTATAKVFQLREDVKRLGRDDTILCRCEDVPLGRVRPFNDWRSAKLQTRCGMGACQGRLCGAASQVLFGTGLLSVRPPLLPTRIASFTDSMTEARNEGLNGGNKT
jgi:NADPH-dependent 2,4-dienoyl-CoA reductase/sulfur reductase-like enzyme